MAPGRTLLFIHGIRRDDPEQEWRAALNRTLRRHGGASLEDRGFEIVAPSYLAELEADDADDGPSPQQTYVKGSDEDYKRAAGRYWGEVNSLEQTGIRGRVAEPPFALNDKPAKLGMDRLFKDAAVFCAEPDRRGAVYGRILAEIPADSELVVIGHSLGSVVAAGLLYYLPESNPVRMLITLGSPLGLESTRKHLSRRRQRFPFERTGPWLNVVATKDLVTGFRGLSRAFPEALDVYFAASGRQREAHNSRTYLDHESLAIAFDWIDHSDENGSEPSTEVEPFLPESLAALVVGAQWALRIEQSEEAGLRRVRMGEARSLICGELEEKLADQEVPVLRHLVRDNTEWLNGRFEPEQMITNLAATWMNPMPFAPYEIEADRETRLKALEHLALDLGAPSRWAEVVARAEAEARPRRRRITPGRVAIAAVGVAAIAVAPALILAAAPAGLAGGAALVGGLAALGPGGMLGGIAVVSAVGGGGGALAAGALVSGTAAQVEENIILIQTIALAGKQLDQRQLAANGWSALVAMQDRASDDLARIAEFSDKNASRVKEQKAKCDAIAAALEWFVARGLGPALLEPGM